VHTQLNLFLAVLKTKFAKAKNLLDEKRRQRRAMKNRRGSKKRNVLARATGWMKSEFLTKLLAAPRVCCVDAAPCADSCHSTSMGSFLGCCQGTGVSAPFAPDPAAVFPLHMLLLQRVSRPTSPPRPATTR
jgi:hypothetical protein